MTPYYNIPRCPHNRSYNCFRWEKMGFFASHLTPMIKNATFHHRWHVTLHTVNSLYEGIVVVSVIYIYMPDTSHMKMCRALLAGLDLKWVESSKTRRLWCGARLSFLFQTSTCHGWPNVNLVEICQQGQSHYSISRSCRPVDMSHNVYLSITRDTQ